MATPATTGELAQGLVTGVIQAQRFCAAAVSVDTKRGSTRDGAQRRSRSLRPAPFGNSTVDARKRTERPQANRRSFHSHKKDCPRAEIEVTRKGGADLFFLSPVLFSVLSFGLP